MYKNSAVAKQFRRPKASRGSFRHSLNMKTVRMRRSRPSVLSLSLALMITMFCVYMASLCTVESKQAETAAVPAAGTAEVRMEGLEAAFICEGRYENQLEARVRAALCAGNGGAGLILTDGSEYAVVSEAVDPAKAPENALLRNASGLTLRLSGPSGEIAAVSDAVGFLRTQAGETGSLARALETGDADASSIRTLLEIYLSQGRRALASLREIQNPDAIAARLTASTENALSRIESAISETDPGKIKLIHAAACGEWISMLNDFSSESA